MSCFKEFTYLIADAFYALEILSMAYIELARDFTTVIAERISLAFGARMSELKCIVSYFLARVAVTQATTPLFTLCLLNWSTYRKFHTKHTPLAQQQSTTQPTPFCAWHTSTLTLHHSRQYHSVVQYSDFTSSLLRTFASILHVRTAAHAPLCSAADSPRSSSFAGVDMESGIRGTDNYQSWIHHDLCQAILTSTNFFFFQSIGLNPWLHRMLTYY